MIGKKMKSKHVKWLREMTTFLYPMEINGISYDADYYECETFYYITLIYGKKETLRIARHLSLSTEKV